MDGVVHIQDDSVLCETCTKCENGCASSPDSKVHDCPDYDKKFSGRFKWNDSRPAICRSCVNVNVGCAPDAVNTCSRYASNYLTTVSSKSDEVNHPNHYNQGGIECIDCIRASMSPEGFQDYCKGNVIKYIHRWRFKGGIQDLHKAQVYLNWLIESAEKEKEKV